MAEMRALNLSRKERDFLRHKKEILTAAEAVFSERGYVSATMEEIAQRAEFAVGTLYKFFENKATLYSETILTRMRELEEEVYQALEIGQTPSDKVQSYFQIRIDLFWKNPRFFRLFMGGPVGTINDANLGFLPQLLERYEALLARVRSLFAQGIETRQFKTLSPELLTLAAEGLLKVYVERLIRQKDAVRNQQEECALFQLFLRGAAK